MYEQNTFIPLLEKYHSERVRLLEDKLFSPDSSTAPFIYFFEEGIKAGVFKNLGEVNDLKEKSPVYANYIDSWLSYAIKHRIIKIQQDGIIQYIDKNHEYYIYEKTELENQLKPIADKITDISIKHAKKNKNSFATCNYYPIANTPEFRKEYIAIVGDFMNKIKTLSLKSTKANVDSIHYAQLSTCTLTKDDLADL